MYKAERTVLVDDDATKDTDIYVNSLHNVRKGNNTIAYNMSAIHLIVQSNCVIDVLPTDIILHTVH